MNIRRQRPRSRSAALLALILTLGLVLTGCSGGKTASTEPEPKPEPSELVLASTTSTLDSGLFDVLLPAFEKDNPEYVVKPIAVGSGEALELGRKKDADVLLVHAKADEETFVAEGYGTERRDVMYNDFIIVGPKSDPAGVKGAADTDSALKAIADKQAVFVSRGDDSGTHKKEKKLWTAAGIKPEGKWYLSVGQGMGEVLRIASEKQGYTLVDRATYLSMKDSIDLDIVKEGDKALFNQYGVIPVKGAKNPEGANAFTEWITSAAGQKVIGEYGKEKFGQALFVPNAK